MPGFQIGQGQGQLQDPARKDLGKFVKAHAGAPIRKGGVVNHQPGCVLLHHQHDLPRGHFRQRRPQVRHDLMRVIDLRAQARRLKCDRKIGQVGIGISPLRDQRFHHVRHRQITAQQPGINRRQIRPRRRPRGMAWRHRGGLAL